MPEVSAFISLAPAVSVIIEPDKDESRRMECLFELSTEPLPQAARITTSNRIKTFLIYNDYLL